MGHPVLQENQVLQGQVGLRVNREVAARRERQGPVGMLDRPVVAEIREAAALVGRLGTAAVQELVEIQVQVVRQVKVDRRALPARVEVPAPPV